MSRIYAQQKRQPPKAAEPSYNAPAAHVPSLVSGTGSSDLDSLMQAKYRQHFLDNQIPTAEAEADRIAASVSGARTPEEVKTQLGEKMGADFSHVTFHTDSAAVNQADAMGARAYTSGSDVYFGSGGFDPGVAAHELVHTVQQGVVDSSMQTTAAPTGGVQMKPGLFSRIGNRIKRAWHDKTSMLHPINRHLEAKQALRNQNAEIYGNIWSQTRALGMPDSEADSIFNRHKRKFSKNIFKRHGQVNRALEWNRKNQAESNTLLPQTAAEPMEDEDESEDEGYLSGGINPYEQDEFFIL